MIFEVIVLCIAIIAATGVLLKFRQAQHWPSTQGVVEAFSHQLIHRGALDNQAVDCQFTIKYRYKINDTYYTGDTLVLGMPNIVTYTSSTLEEFSCYGVGRQVEVFYDPKSPSNSALEVLNSPGKKNPLLVISLFFLFTVGIIVSGIVFITGLD